MRGGSDSGRRLSSRLFFPALPAVDVGTFPQPLPVAAAFLRSGRVELFGPADAPGQHGHDFPVRLVELSLHRTSLHPLGTPPCSTPYGKDATISSRIDTKP